MPLGQIAINGQPYTLVDPSRVNTAPRQYRETMRPSQPSEARLNTKTWNLSGPIGNSRQQNFGDPLGPDYTINLDGRNEGLLTSAAARNAVALTAVTAYEAEAPTSDVTATNWAVGGTGAGPSAFNDLDTLGLFAAAPWLDGGAIDDAAFWRTSTNSAPLVLGYSTPAGNVRPAGSEPVAVFGWRFRSSIADPNLTLKVTDGTDTLWQQSGVVTALADVWTSVTGSITPDNLNGIMLGNIELSIERNSGAGTLDCSTEEIVYPLENSGSIITIDEDRGAIFVTRGSHVFQINPTDMSEVDDVDLARLITDSIPSWRGKGIVALGQIVSRERTTVTAASSTYTALTNVDAVHLAVGPDRLWMVDNSDGQVKYITPDLAVTMTNFSNGIIVADTNSGHITGLYTLGELMIAGTQRGARSFLDSGAPAILGEAVKDFPSSLNGAAGDSLWGWHYHATKLGLYAISPDGRIENPVGPGEGRAGRQFEGPIDGYPIAVKAFKDSLWVSYLTPDGDSWILRGEFDERITPGSGRPNWYVFRKLTGVECSAIGATTGRTVPALVWGEGSDIAYADLAFRGREIADTTNYVYGTDGGEWFGTTLMLPVGLVGNVRWAKFLTENCDANNTWTLAVSRDEGAQADIGSAVTTNGLQTVRDAATDDNSFTTIKPRLTQVAASSSAPPQIRGDLTIAYDERPEHVREIECVVEGNGSDLADLQTLVDSGTPTPVPMRTPFDTAVNTDKYCYVLEAQGADLRDSDDQGIRVRLLEWVVA